MKSRIRIGEPRSEGELFLKEMFLKSNLMLEKGRFSCIYFKIYILFLLILAILSGRIYIIGIFNSLVFEHKYPIVSNRHFLNISPDHPGHVHDEKNTAETASDV